jgi:hypothetical protein
MSSMRSRFHNNESWTVPQPHGARFKSKMNNPVLYVATLEMRTLQVHKTKGQLRKPVNDYQPPTYHDIDRSAVA